MFSCWDGEYETENYKKLSDIKKKLFERDDKGYLYTPSVEGAKELVTKAQENLKKIRIIK
jgi:hypothetical protein